MKKLRPAVIGFSLIALPLSVALANWDALPFERPPHPNLDIKSSRDSLTIDVSEYSSVIVVANNSGRTISHLQFNTSTFKNNLGVYHGLGELKDGEQRVVVAYNRSPGLVRMTWVGEKAYLGYHTELRAGVPVLFIIGANDKVSVTNFNLRGRKEATTAEPVTA